MHDHQTEHYSPMERFSIALMIGFALALGFALYELDAVAESLDSSFAAIARIGGWAF
jgi:hypothetical protein